MNAPTAEIVHIQGGRCFVRCPYCMATHEHMVRAAELGQTEHRAPGCGIVRSTRQRLAGYTFTTTKEK